MPTIPQLQMPDIVGNYAKGQEIKYQKDERARKQPIMEQMEKLALQKAETANKTATSAQTLKDFENKGEVLKVFSQGMDWINEQPVEAQPELLEDLNAYIGESGIDIGDDIQNNPDLMAKLGSIRGGGDASGAERFFNNLTAEMSDEDVLKAKRMQVGLDPKAGTASSKERIAQDENLSDAVATSSAKEAESVARAKARVKLQTEPEIQKQIAAGKYLAEDLDKFKNLQASMPRLREVTGTLAELADLATYTKSGKIFNAAAKEFGFQPEGDTARKSMENIIDNEILPLLKQTFGAAFTFQEGQALKGTLLDIDSTGDAKKLALQNFIDSKEGQVETLGRKLIKSGYKPPYQPKEGDIIQGKDGRLQLKSGKWVKI